MYMNNHDVVVQIVTKKFCNVFKNQLNCTSQEVLNLSVFNFFSNSKKKKLCYLLILNKKKSYDNCAGDSHLIGYL